MRISASSIATWQLCQRRWAFRYLRDREEPTNDSAEAGRLTHKMLEDGGVDESVMFGRYPVGRMAALLRAATPQDVIDREKWFEVDLYGVTFVGFVDWRTARVLGDYKTTSQSRYIKKALRDNPQRLLYVAAHPDVEETLWLYGSWREMKVTEVREPVDRDGDTERFKLKVLTPAEHMLAVPKDTDPLSLPANTAACSLYPPNGCPFYGECFGV